MIRPAEATPLPWTPKDGEGLNRHWWQGRLYAGERLVAEVSVTNGPSGEDGRINFHYMQHAAHAYPKLVAAIREDLQGYLGDFPAGHSATKLRNLLRELGETT